MDIKVKTKEFIFEQEKFFPQCHASTLAILENDDIIAAWFGGTHEQHPDVAIWLSRRQKGRWSAPVKIADKDNVPCWNPVLFNSPEGKLFLFYKAGKNPMEWRTMVMTSRDGGFTWSQPKELVEGDVGGRGPVRCKPIVLSKGTWLAPASIETPEKWDCFVDMSKDKGQTWIKSHFVPIDHKKLQGKGIIQPTLWESQPGKVHMLIRSTEGFVYRSDSDDYGTTWSQAYPTKLPNNNSGIDLIKMDNGVLVLVYNPVSGNWAERTPLVCSISKDNGQTWEEKLVLDRNHRPKNREDGEFSYPAIIAKKDRIYITYTWKRKTIAFYELQVENIFT